jgi:hypothetical protein
MLLHLYIRTSNVINRNLSIICKRERIVMELTGLILQVPGLTGDQVAQVIIGSLAAVLAAYVAIMIFWQHRKERRSV